MLFHFKSFQAEKLISNNISKNHYFVTKNFWLALKYDRLVSALKINEPEVNLSTITIFGLKVTQ